jgi:ABC-type Fe3+/spermidine/putrescine transport system ATPase subunit
VPIPALTLTDVSHSYGSRSVLVGVSLTVEVGCLTCLTGPSGCGKTTLLKIVAGLEHPRGGEIRINGQEASKIPTNERDIGFVFQSESALFHHLNVRDNVRFPFTHGRKHAVNNDPEAAVNKILDRTGLTQHANHRIANLSGGLKQRVAIARALVYEPAILLLDEPLSSLDNPRKDALLGLLDELKATRDHTFLYVTHDDREIKEIADRVAILNEGSIIQESSLEEVLKAPAADIVCQILRIDCSSKQEAPGGRSLT